MLQVKKDKIVNAEGKPVQLRGPNAGGWMNMENFINGYPGAEHGIRSAFVGILGSNKAQFFFDRLLDYFLAEDDIAFMKECGATAVRLPFNYRHFENDAEPFKYLERGFQRLDQAVQWCAKHGLYAILDFHSVQGWQNADWHCDNASRRSLLWQHPHFQERFVSLWEELARRYKGNSAIAGYDVINEPLTNAAGGRFSHKHTPDWEAINSLYRRVVKAIRDIDPEHIIFLEGDLYAISFSGLDEPFAENLVYNSHNYNAAGFGPGVYPGTFNGMYWDRALQRETFLACEGTQFTRRHNVPLWVSEFGSVYNGRSEEKIYRLKALDDQIDVFEEFGAHWAMWTYKDAGIMGWVELDPESEYMRIIAPILEAKRLLRTDYWMHWLPSPQAEALINGLSRLIEKAIGDPGIDPHDNESFLAQAALSGYAGTLMQPAYAGLFKDMTESRIDSVLQSFALKNCKPNQELIGIVKKHMLDTKSCIDGS
ncbi:MAG: glycoside hydrolase family 5 protein [Spirochaetes bacterium]|nr:glycoside hydrolase family 5 protein [Spirochaetota bacterium]